MRRSHLRGSRRYGRCKSRQFLPIPLRNLPATGNAVRADRPHGRERIRSVGTPGRFAGATALSPLHYQGVYEILTSSGGLGRTPWAVVSWVEAGIIHRAVNFYPVRAVNSSAVIRGGAHGKGARDFEPAVLLCGDVADFIGHFR